VDDVSNETIWRTDEPCPVCASGLFVTEDGGLFAWADCRLCGWVGPLDLESFGNCFGGSTSDDQHDQRGTQDQG
jgi:hypothetical protein